MRGKAAKINTLEADIGLLTKPPPPAKAPPSAHLLYTSSATAGAAASWPPPAAGVRAPPAAAAVALWEDARPEPAAELQEQMAWFSLRDKWLEVHHNRSLRHQERCHGS